MSPLVSLLIARTVAHLSALITTTEGWVSSVLLQVARNIQEHVLEDDIQLALDEAINEKVGQTTFDVSDHFSASDIAQEFDVEDVANYISVDDVASFVDAPEIDYEELASQVLESACYRDHGSMVFQATVAALVKATAKYAALADEE